MPLLLPPSLVSKGPLPEAVAGESESIAAENEMRLYCVNEERYFQSTDLPPKNPPQDDLGDSLCDQYEVTAATDSLCALCRSTFSEKLYRHLAHPEGRFQHHKWSRVQLCSKNGCRFCRYLVFIIKKGNWKYPVSSQAFIITRGLKTKGGVWSWGTILDRYSTKYHDRGFLTDIGLHDADSSIKIHVMLNNRPGPVDSDYSNVSDSSNDLDDSDYSNDLDDSDGRMSSFLAEIHI
jgi:hypothetical protein